MDEAEAAIQVLDGSKFLDHTIRVSWAFVKLLLGVEPVEGSSECCTLSVVTLTAVSSP